MGAHQGQDLRRGQALGGRIVRDALVGGGGLGGPGVPLHAEPVAGLVLAVQHQPGARGVLVRQPRLVEERRLHRSGAVGDGCLHQRPHPPASHRPRSDASHLDDDRGGLPGNQLGDRAGFPPVPRQVLEQVADGLDAQRTAGLLRLGVVEAQPARELRGARIADRSLGQLGWIQRPGGGERRRGHDQMMTSAAVGQPVTRPTAATSSSAARRRTAPARHRRRSARAPSRRPAARRPRAGR